MVEIPQKGQLLGLYLDDKTWALGQIVTEPNWWMSLEPLIRDYDVVAFKNIKVDRLDQLDLENIVLDKKDVVFLITSSDSLTTNVNRVKKDKHNESMLLLPYIHPVVVDEIETRRYRATLQGQNPSIWGGLSGKMSVYFGLYDWDPVYENPELNFAVHFNPDIRPPNARLHVSKSIKPDEIPSMFSFFFNNKESLLRSQLELKSMGYKFVARKKEGKKYMLLMSRFVDPAESCDELDEILGPVAEKWGGVYDGMFEV